MTNEELQYFIELKNRGITGNELKNKIQTYAINKWLKEFNGRGYIKAYTGFGKSYMTKQVFTRFENKFPERNKGVIVPNSGLLDSFKAMGTELNLKNYYTYIINSYVMGNDVVKEYGLFVVDELHRVCSEFSEFFKLVIPSTTMDLFLGISATLSKEHEDFLKTYNLHEVFEITLEEGIRLGIASLYTILNIGVDMDIETIEKFKTNERLFTSTFNLFKQIPQYNSMQLALACSMKVGQQSKVERIYKGDRYIELRSTDEWVEIVSNYLGEEPKLIKDTANIFRGSMMSRNNIVNKCKSKIEAVEQLINGFDEGICSISFLATIDQADSLEKKTHLKALSYHSKIKKSVKTQRLQLFKNGGFNHLLTIKSFDEGQDVPRANVGIDFHFFSNPIQTIQRLGRILRVEEKNPNKKPYFIFIYCKPVYEIGNTDGMNNFVPPDYKKMIKLQEEMVNVINTDTQGCLEIINRK